MCDSAHTPHTHTLSLCEPRFRPLPEATSQQREREAEPMRQASLSRCMDVVRGLVQPLSACALRAREIPEWGSGRCSH